MADKEKALDRSEDSDSDEDEVHISPEQIAESMKTAKEFLRKELGESANKIRELIEKNIKDSAESNRETSTITIVFERKYDQNIKIHVAGIIVNEKISTNIIWRFEGYQKLFCEIAEEKLKGSHLPRKFIHIQENTIQHTVNLDDYINHRYD